MPRFPILDQPLVIIELEPGQVSPPGAMWVEIGPVLRARWSLDGNIPERRGRMSPYGGYEHLYEATQAAIDYAMNEGVDTLWIEFDARRCD